MSFKRNGHKRDPKLVLGGIFMVFIGLILIGFAAFGTWAKLWYGIGAIIIFLGVISFKNANEM